MSKVEHAALPLVHEVHQPPTSAPAGGYPTIVAIHGRGSYAGDLLGLAPYLGAGWQMIAPQAPTQIGSGFHWYDLIRVGEPEPRSFDHSLNLLRQFVAQIPSVYPVDPQRIVLLGFSQGAVMSYALGLTQPDQITGIAALSGYIAPQTQQDANQAALANLPVLLTHGTRDSVIPIMFAHQARAWLEQTPARLAYHEYPMGHEIGSRALDDLIGWLGSRAAPSVY